MSYDNMDFYFYLPLYGQFPSTTGLFMLNYTTCRFLQSLLTIWMHISCSYDMSYVIYIWHMGGQNYELMIHDELGIFSVTCLRMVTIIFKKWLLALLESLILSQNFTHRLVCAIYYAFCLLFVIHLIIRHVSCQTHYFHYQLRLWVGLVDL